MNRNSTMMQRGADLQWNNDHVNPFGNGWGCCPPLFESCTDSGILQLFHGLDAADEALRWFGFRKAETQLNKRAYLTYIGPQGAAAGAPNTGLPLNICGPGDAVEMGEPCYMEECGFGEIRKTSDPLKNGGTSNMYCKERVAHTVDIDGTGVKVVDNDIDWWQLVLSTQILEHLACRLLVGDSTNTYGGTTKANDSAGLFELFSQTYNCQQLQPDIIDWGGNPLCANAPMGGITVNGTAVTSPKYTMNIYTVLRALIYNNMRKLKATRLIGGRSIQFGDVAVLGPDYGAECLIECAACFAQCGTDMTKVDINETTVRYNEMMTGGMGYGAIPIGNMSIPYIPYNPLDWTDPTRGKMENPDGTVNYMVLWRGIGGNNGRRFLQPEFNDLSDGTHETANNGQFQTWMSDDNRCSTINMATEWRWWSEAPFMQTLITNAKCESLFNSYAPGDLTAQGALC